MRNGDLALILIGEEFQDLSPTQREYLRMAAERLLRYSRRFGNILCSYCGEKEVYAKGLCRNCYGRMLRNGSPEPKPKRVKEKPPEKPVEPWRYRLLRDVMQTEPGDQFNSKEIDDALSLLPPRNQFVIACRYRENMTLEKTGKIMERSRERVRQMQVASIKKLRAILRWKQITEQTPSK